MARARRARRRRVLLSVAAGPLLLIGGVFLGRTLPTSDSTIAAPVRTVVLQVARDGPVRAEAGLAARPWGTAVSPRCRAGGRTGAPVRSVSAPRPVYTLCVHNPDGSSQQIAQWSPPPGQDVDVQAATDLPPDAVRGLEARTGTGLVVLTG